MVRFHLPFISRRIFLIILIPVFVIVGLFVLFFSAPYNFPRGIVVTVVDGASIAEVATLLSSKHIVRSPQTLEYLIRFSGVAIAGDYIFPQAQNVIAVALRLAKGQYGIIPIKVMIPEGATTYNIAALIAQLVPNFDTKSFITKAQSREGYLFPDTYYFQPTWGGDQMIEIMAKQFETKTKPLVSFLNRSGRTWEQVVIMASLLEREAHTTLDRQMIAGVLWKRLDQGMPLQVDAVFPYIVGKNTFEVSRADLATSSPYNTYRYRGLPIGPIANPGLDALTAALTPVESNFLFYLSDQAGVFHYAADFAEHKRNRAKYLP